MTYKMYVACLVWKSCRGPVGVFSTLLAHPNSHIVNKNPLCIEIIYLPCIPLLIPLKGPWTYQISYALIMVDTGPKESLMVGWDEIDSKSENLEFLRIGSPGRQKLS